MISRELVLSMTLSPAEYETYARERARLKFDPWVVSAGRFKFLSECWDAYRASAAPTAFFEAVRVAEAECCDAHPDFGILACAVAHFAHFFPRGCYVHANPGPFVEIRRLLAEWDGAQCVASLIQKHLDEWRRNAGELAEAYGRASNNYLSPARLHWAEATAELHRLIDDVFFVETIVDFIVTVSSDECERFHRVFDVMRRCYPPQSAREAHITFLKFFAPAALLLILPIKPEPVSVDDKVHHLDWKINV